MLFSRVWPLDGYLEGDYTRILCPYESLLASEGMPAELAPIPRGGHPGLFDDPPPEPAVHHEGRRHPLDEGDAMELAMEFIHKADPPLTGHDLFVWSMYVARVPGRRMAEQLGISRRQVFKMYLNPLCERAGLPTVKID